MKNQRPRSRTHVIADSANAGGPDAPNETPALEVWTDETVPTIEKIVELQKLHRHVRSLQKQVLAGVGVVFVVTLVALVAAPALGFISEDYARFLAQMIIPTALASGATIVGTLFSVKA